MRWQGSANNRVKKNPLQAIVGLEVTSLFYVKPPTRLAAGEGS